MHIMRVLSVAALSVAATANAQTKPAPTTPSSGPIARAVAAWA